MTDPIEPPFKVPLSPDGPFIAESGDGILATCATPEIARYLAIAGTYFGEYVDALRAIKRGAPGCITGAEALLSRIDAAGKG